MRDHAGLMEADLRKYVEQIDLLDGKMDGKVRHLNEKVACAGCDRTILGTSNVCPYCGTLLKRKSVFSNA